jgi:hypothetical protein
MKSILEKSRYLAIIGVVSLLIAAVTAFAWGLIKTINTIALVITSAGRDAAIIIEFIKIVDGFLVATAILIFALSLCKRTPRLKAGVLSLNPKVRDHWQVYNCPVNPKADAICTRSISTATTYSQLVRYCKPFLHKSGVPCQYYIILKAELSEY